MIALGTKGVAVDVGIGVSVAGGSGVNVGGIGEGMRVGGTVVEAGAHPLARIGRRTNARMIDPFGFLMTLSPLDLIVQQSA